MEARWLSAKELAVEVRKVLQAAFPGTKFSVKSRSFSMGSAVDVRWTDGPPGRLVDVALAPLQGVTFDAMTDSKGYQPATLPTGEVVRHGSWLDTQRDVSDFDARVAAVLEVLVAGFVPGTSRAMLEDKARVAVRRTDYRKPEALDTVEAILAAAGSGT